MSDVTRILSQIGSGDPSAAGQLLPVVNDELRKLAAAKLVQQSRDREARFSELPVPTDFPTSFRAALG